MWIFPIKKSQKKSREISTIKLFNNCFLCSSWFLFYRMPSSRCPSWGGRQGWEAEKDTVCPVSEGPTQHHPCGQRLHPCVVSMQTLPPLPGPLPITEVYLKNSDLVESLSQLCSRENKVLTPLIEQWTGSIFKTRWTPLLADSRDSRLLSQRTLE